MEQRRTTPEFITSLEPNEIFVFGSNLSGMHFTDDDISPLFKEAHEVKNIVLPPKNNYSSNLFAPLTVWRKALRSCCDS